jgi:hypothetical protein
VFAPASTARCTAVQHPPAVPTCTPILFFAISSAYRSVAAAPACDRGVRYHGLVTPSVAAQATRTSFTASRPRIKLLIALCTVPLIVLLLIAPFELSRLPILDDYPAVLGFAAQLHDQPLLSRLDTVVTFQHTQYKFIVGQAIMALQYGVSHHIDFAILGIIGNLFVIPLAFVFFAQFLPELSLERRLLLFLPVPFLLYQLTYAESLDWSLVAMQTIAVVTFALPALYFVARGSSRKDMALACVFAVLAVFSSINAFLISIIGGVILLARRQFVYLFSWIMAFALGLAVYLHHYIYSPDAHSPIHRSLVYAVSFLGADFETMHRKPFHGAAILFGALFLAVALHAALHRYSNKRPFMMGVVAWSIMTAVVVGVGRARYGVGQSLSSRYKLYSAMMLVFCYQYAVEWCLARPGISQRIQRRLYIVALAFSVCFCAGADVAGMNFLHKRRMVMHEGIAWYLRSPGTHSPSTPGADPPNPTFDHSGAGIEARVLLQQSIADGDYRLPAKEVARACARFGCSATSSDTMPPP